MSQRGSFVTEYIYCDKCFEAAKIILLQDDKELRSFVMPPPADPTDKQLPIIAGKIGGGYVGSEFDMFEMEIIPKLTKVICHPIRIAVLSEDEERLYTVIPDKK